MAREISFAFLIVAALAACVGDDPDTTGTNPGTDAGTSSGGPAGTNLVENGSFENGCGGPLFASNGDISSFTEFGKTGAKSCKLCRTPGGEPSLYLYAALDVKPKAGETYAVSAYVRKVPNAEVPGSSQFTVIGLDQGGSSMGENGAVGSAPSALTDEWKPANITWKVAQDGAERVRIDLGLPSAADGICFLVDDLFFAKQ